MILHSRPWLNDEDQSAVAEALACGWIGAGQKVDRFEAAVTHWVEGSAGVSVGSGTAALQLALHAVGCGPGDEVLMPTYVCRSVMNAVLQSGAKPILCDAGTHWVSEAEQFSAKLSQRTKCIIAPHLYGIFCNIEEIAGLGVPVIEDLAQAMPAHGTRKLRADYGVFSFHPTKCLTTGEGGMIVAKGADQAERLKEIAGMNIISQTCRMFPRLSDISASLGLTQLSRYPEFLSRRRSIAEKYAECLSGSAADTRWYGNRESMFFRFPFQWFNGFDAVVDHMARLGVTVRRGVDELMHRLLGESDRFYPMATAYYNKTVSLPIYPSLTEIELKTCLHACEAIFK